MFLILRKSCHTENISYRTLNFISKWVEYVSLKVPGHSNEFIEQINRISKNCLWDCRYLNLQFLKNTRRFTFLFEFDNNARGWYMLLKS